MLEDSDVSVNSIAKERTNWEFGNEDRVRDGAEFAIVNKDG